MNDMDEAQLKTLSTSEREYYLLHKELFTTGTHCANTTYEFKFSRDTWYWSFRLQCVVQQAMLSR